MTATTTNPKIDADGDGSLLAACLEATQLFHAYAAASANEGAEIENLVALQAQREQAMLGAAELLARTAAGARAKAELLLMAIDRAELTPDLELARSLAHDVLAGQP